MKNRILLTAALCMSMMAQITAQGYTSLREQIQLAGEWESSLGTCRLPGTTDENRLGERNRDTLVTYQLTRLYPYSGKVIYTREINIPESFRGKKLFLMMERTKPSTVWVDGDSIGSYGHLYAPHRYELPALAVGKHQLKSGSITHRLLSLKKYRALMPGQMLRKRIGTAFWENFISKQFRFLISSRCRYIRKWIRNKH